MSKKRWALVAFLTYATLIGAVMGNPACIVTGLWVLLLVPA